MSIELQFARQAWRRAYHQLTIEDTQADLNEWFDSVGVDQLQPPNGEWVKDIAGGTCTYWDTSNGYYLQNVPLGVGDYLVAGNPPLSAADFEKAFFTP